MKKEGTFKVGDKVFAKVKGYPPWPAIVLEDNGKKYKVKFYGTGEIGQIKIEDLFYYSKNKQKFLKSTKRKDFNDSVQQIEEAIKAAGTDGSPDYEQETTEDSALNDTTASADIESSLSTKKRKRSASVAKSSNDSTAGKSKKRKSISSDKSNSTSPALEKKNGDCEEKDIIETEVKNEVETENKADLDASKVEDTKEISETIETAKSDQNITDESNSLQQTSKSQLSIAVDKEPQCTAQLDIKDYVMEKELEAFIGFGNHVEKHKEIYHEMPVEQRYDSEVQVLPFISSNKTIGIKMHPSWPLKNFKNEYERALYDKDIAMCALNLKKSFKMDCLNESPTVYRECLGVNQEDFEKNYQEKLLAIKEEILENLKIESSLLEIDSKIKSCLNLDKADPKEALSLLEGMLTLKLNAIMLKKHAHVVDMVRRLRKYVGNIESWSLNEDEKKTFKKDAEEVRKTALKVYVKFMQIVGKPPSADTFWDAFNNIATKFREETKDLSEAEFYMLSCEPYSRKNFLNNHFIKDMPLNLTFPKKVAKDSEPNETVKEEEQIASK